MGSRGPKSSSQLRTPCVDSPITEGHRVDVEKLAEVHGVFSFWLVAESDDKGDSPSLQKGDCHALRKPTATDRRQRSGLEKSNGRKPSH
jgi:hypothetical protein